MLIPTAPTSSIEYPHRVDCAVDSPRFPAALALKPAGQIARIVYVIRDFAGLESVALTACSAKSLIMSY